MGAVEAAAIRDRQPLRVVILGYGLAGAVFHAPLLAATPGMLIAAIVTSDPERQAKVRRDYPAARIYPTADAVWQDAASYDLVVIATPNRVHVPLGLAALEAGLPIVVDKPVAPSVAGARELFAASERSGKFFTVFQNLRWDGDFLTVRALVASGALGPITRFESRFECYQPEPKAGVWREQPGTEEAGGLLFDLGSHLIDQALQLFGQPVQVYAEVEQRRPGAQVDDDTFVALRFGSGMYAHLWMSMTAPLQGPRFRVSGLRGAYEIYGIDPQEEALMSGKRPGDAGWGRTTRDRRARVLLDVGGPQVRGQVETVPGAYEQFYAQLRDALQQGAPLPVQPQDAIAALQVIEAARQSAQTGLAIRL